MALGGMGKDAKAAIPELKTVAANMEHPAALRELVQQTITHITDMGKPSPKKGNGK